MKISRPRRGVKILKICSYSPRFFIRRVNQFLELRHNNLTPNSSLLEVSDISLIINMFDDIMKREIRRVERWEMKRLKVEILHYLRLYFDEHRHLIYAELKDRKQWEV